MTAQTAQVQVPLSLEQLAFALRQVPPKHWEDLEMMLDEKFRKTVLQRGKTAKLRYKQGKTLNLKDLQKEFSL